MLVFWVKDAVGTLFYLCPELIIFFLQSRSNPNLSLILRIHVSPFSKNQDTFLSKTHVSFSVTWLDAGSDLNLLWH